MKNIIYTITDEAPALATYSLLPVIKSFAKVVDIEVETSDISLAARVLANFSGYLTEAQQVKDSLVILGDLSKDPSANIIKLPNISASLPQLKSVIKELQGKGYQLPNYPEEPQSEEDIEIKNKYDQVKGSAVNPVLREGNSDRRVPKAVKTYAQHNPHSMGAWDSNSKSHVSSMQTGDFYANEKSVTLTNDDTFSIVFESKEGNVEVLKKSTPLQQGEVIDASKMSYQSLVKFFQNEVADAKEKGILFSVHLKATMMKVSDPIIYGIAVKVFFRNVFDKFQKELDKIGVNPNNGLGDLLSKINKLPKETENNILKEIESSYANGPALAMVNSDKGITGLHVPSDIIIDASMPAAIRTSGGMWGPDGKLADMKAVIPDRSYAGVYQTVIDFCKRHGAFDPSTMGSVPNVGLMANKAEEYGSHDKTFQAKEEGIIKVLNQKGQVLLQHTAQVGDIWRMCQTKDAAIKDWVKLAINRVKASMTPAIFWLDNKRAHDSELIKKVNDYLQEFNATDLDITIMSPIEATQATLERLIKGEDTIAVTGNVLRDYLTDLFPILEVGTSAKMLSIVPLMNGGGLFETGAGGSAPKHVQQFETEGHLRWDSLGEFLALGASFDHFATVHKNPTAKILAETMDNSITKLLIEKKSPSRKVNEIDNRGSHFYLAMYWAEALSTQNENIAISQIFKPIYLALKENEEKINSELLKAQAAPQNNGGYYLPDNELAIKNMRPSITFNNIIDTIST